MYDILDMQSEISAIFISEEVDLFIIATQNMELSFIKFTKNEHNLDLKMIDSVDLHQFSGSNDECLDESIVVAIRVIHN